MVSYIQQFKTGKNTLLNVRSVVMNQARNASKVKSYLTIYQETKNKGAKRPYFKERKMRMERKVKIFEVQFFVQQGMLMGGEHEVETVVAFSKEEAIAELKKKRGEGFRLVSIKQTGAQG
jgi:hypothetical protein